MEIYSSDLAGIVNGRLTGPSYLPVTDIVTDSRQLIFSEGLVFFAIKGKNHDGHQFIPSLYSKGIRVFVTGRKLPDYPAFPDAAFIETADTTEALQLLAAYKRSGVNTKVIAVTGSAGKTIVKEWLAEIIGKKESVVRSPKSYNSQIGVPLSVWKLDDRFCYGIFEAGISFPGEMDKLEKVIRPDIGVITNIGDAHRENFPDDKTKTIEKLKLFRNSAAIVYCRDQEIIRSAIENDITLSCKRLVDWSFMSRDAAVFASKYSAGGSSTGLTLVFSDSEYVFTIPFTDRASIENAVTVASVCLAIGLPYDIISRGLKGLVSVAMRMELKSGVNNCQLIEDFYNSDPGSLGMAIEYLMTQTGRKHTLILSDFVQSGRSDTELYSDVASLTAKAGVERFIGIGPGLSANAELFGPDAKFFGSTDDFLHVINQGQFRDEVILLKGARMFEFEKIARQIELQIHQTTLEVNLDAIAHNLNEFRKLLKPDTRMMAMVKAFAYGAGSAEIASVLEYNRVSYLAVACADEGFELRNAGVTLPVMVMNPDPSSVDFLIKYDLEPVIFSFESLKNFSQAASRHGLVNYPVHIKIDSGMHRLGFLPEELDKLAVEIRTGTGMKIVSVFSHLSASDDPSLDEFSRKQADIFLKAVEKIRDATGYSFIRHILNSSGIVRLPQFQFDMVRPGIGIYGVGHFDTISLRPAGRFKTRISQVKWVKAGEPVGYGCADVSDHERLIAILPAGYADGLRRILGNRNGSLFIRHKKVPIIGNICMDMCMADVTGTGAGTGDEAEIFGENISIEEVAGKCGTIPYEILTSIPMRVKRIFYRE